jgi:geranylgeranyl diphosphate synthase type II
LKHLFSSENNDLEGKVEIVKQIFTTSGSAEATKKAITSYTKKAFEVLQTLTITDKNKQILQDFGTQLMTRDV